MNDFHFAEVDVLRVSPQHGQDKVVFTRDWNVDVSVKHIQKVLPTGNPRKENLGYYKTCRKYRKYNYNFYSYQVRLIRTCSANEVGGVTWRVSRRRE